MKLDYSNRRADPEGWARELGISRAAVDLYLASDVIDLHVDSFIWNRIFGYRLERSHGLGLFGGRFYSQVDFPRILEGGLTGATWVITTNPLRSAAGRARAFAANLERLRGIFAGVSEQFTVVEDVAGYRAAREAGKHAAFLAIQGGSALDRDADALDLIPGRAILRVTVVHLYSSSLGTTSAPLRRGGDTGLTDAGRDFVRRLEARRIFPDLAHISRQGFWDAVEVHDRTLPLLVTHTGVCGVHEHWRNLDDRQLRAVADSGGVAGIMYQSSFLDGSFLGCRAEAVVRHLEHAVQTIGDDHVALGSDWDGAITPPLDLKTPVELPRLVELMLARGMKESSIVKILGANFLRVVQAMRG
ncbi:MAG: membrane dipeptidase [Polyangiaceae bacterium]|nr:membrane dipeptidase [Polyangiaceae bacterium]